MSTNEWQDIANAPRSLADSILVCTKYGYQAVAVWKGDQWVTSWSHNIIGDDREVTHWKALGKIPTKNNVLNQKLDEAIKLLEALKEI